MSATNQNANSIESDYRMAAEAKEDIFESDVRPKFMREFVGQINAMMNLATYIEASKIRQLPLDHTLLSGPPGLGKTTVAQIIAHETCGDIKTIIGPAVQRAADLAAVLAGLDEGDVLFIDEIHRVPPAVVEILYSAMEDFALDVMIGEGATSRTMRIDIPRFTLVGATTRVGALPSPLVSRFGIHLTFSLYDVGDLITIVDRSAGLIGTKIEKDASLEIASRSRGTPRIANMLLRRVHDFALVAGLPSITGEITNAALTRMNIDHSGLDDLDRRYLECIRFNYAGGPVGIDAIAASLAESRDTIEDQVEPFLMRSGYILRTARGRMLGPRSESDNRTPRDQPQL